MKIEQLIRRFRKAIDIAFAEGEFRNHPPFSRFPKDCCDFACDLLGQFLLENGIETHQVNGTCKTDMTWHHAWLLTDDGIAIDITGDQFIGRLVSAGEILPTYVGSENKIHMLFQPLCFRNLRLHLHDEHLQFFLAFLSRMCIDIS